MCLEKKFFCKGKLRKSKIMSIITNDDINIIIAIISIDIYYIMNVDVVIKQSAKIRF